MEEACSKIVACVPGPWDPDAVDSHGNVGDWVPPGPARSPTHRELFAIVRRKQMHNCKPVGHIGCREKSDHCKGHFPQPKQLSHAPVYDTEEKCYRYYCPGQENRNVVPYVPVSTHPACLPCLTDTSLRPAAGRYYLLACFHVQELMLIFNSHQNVQRIIESAWSYYLLKYSMKVGSGRGLAETRVWSGYISGKPEPPSKGRTAPSSGCCSGTPSYPPDPRQLLILLICQLPVVH